MVWCDFTSQLNKIVEQILYFDGSAWGDTFKYITENDDWSFETVNSPGEDRIVKASTTITSKGYLTPEFAGDKNTMQKGISVTKVVVGETIVTDINNLPRK